MLHDDAAHLATANALEQQTLASALGQEDKHVLLFFHSAACSLCRTISSVVDEEQHRRRDSLEVASICTDGTQAWAPEMLNYNVKAVPCFVLLEPGGSAIAKSGKPRSNGHVAAALHELLSLVPGAAKAPAAKQPR